MDDLIVFFRCMGINHKNSISMKTFILGIALSSFCFATTFAQDLGNIFKNVATDVYVRESFTNPGQFGTIPLAGPYFPIPNIIATNTFNFLGGDFNASGTLYAFIFQSPDYVLVTVDLNTGAGNFAATVSGVVSPQFLTQLSYNFTNDTYYALSNDPNNNSGTQFYEVNIATGVLTPIGTGTGIPNGVAMEIDNTGTAYAADANSGNLYTIDITTGVGTVVGNMIPSGLHPVRSGFSIDHSTNVMYAVMPNSNGVIRSRWYTVNLATGALTDLGDGSSRQYNLFAIAGGVLGVGEAALESLIVYPNPATDIINIENPIGIVLKCTMLYDMLGRNTGAVLVNGAMNIENLAKGIYILKLETERGMLTQKIIKN